MTIALVFLQVWVIVRRSDCSVARKSRKDFFLKTHPFAHFKRESQSPLNWSCLLHQASHKDNRVHTVFVNWLFETFLAVYADMRPWGPTNFWLWVKKIKPLQIIKVSQQAVYEYYYKQTHKLPQPPFFLKKKIGILWSPKSFKQKKHWQQGAGEEEQVWLFWWPLRQREASYIKQEGKWPCRVNRLWAVSHSWHAHNYSISSTINGNSLKLQGEIKQTPSPYPSNLSASTRLPISPFHSFTSQSSRRVIPTRHSI